jgi:alkylation response protein AidB-like acyl-CoA dehydrogenase
VRVFARPTKLRVEIGTNEVRLVDGPKGWRNGKEVRGMQYEAMVLQAVRLDLPWQLLAH